MRPRKTKRPSLQDIASRVGTTKMTVSRCLRQPETVSEPLRTRIVAAAEELDYLPNRAPVQLSQSRSLTIGILVPSVTNQVFSEVLAGALEVGSAAGYQVMISHYGYSPELEERNLTSLLSLNIDGAILSDSTHTERTRRMIAQAGLPTVEIMDTRTPPVHQAVGYDNHAAARAMVERMIAAGRRDIVYLAVRLDERTLQRQNGYAEAMAAHGLTPDIVRSSAKSSFSGGSAMMAQLLRSRPQTDAIFCTNDDVAVGAYFECLRHGLSVPRDMAIAGFHGLDVGQAMVPRLASVVTPRREIGAVATRQLLARATGEPGTEAVIDLGYTISGGDTLTAPPR